MTHTADSDAAYRRGYADGRNQTAAWLVGVVAAELGHDHPVIDRMVTCLGSIEPPSVIPPDKGHP